MRQFIYNIKDSEGKATKGVLEAESKQKLIEHFHAQGAIIFSVEEAKSEVKKRKGRKVKTDELVVFSRQFTTLIESGIPVVECLGILTEQVEQAYFKQAIGDILREVKEGSALSSALSKYRDIFPDIYLSMVEAAEASGNLPEILDRVSIYLEKSSALRKKVMSALYYPAVIVLMAIAITSFLVFKVIPTFKEIFIALGGALPLPTRLLIQMGTPSTVPPTSAAARAATVLSARSVPVSSRSAVATICGRPLTIAVPSTERRSMPKTSSSSPFPSMRPCSFMRAGRKSAIRSPPASTKRVSACAAPAHMA